MKSVYKSKSVLKKRRSFRKGCGAALFLCATLLSSAVLSSKTDIVQTLEERMILDLEAVELTQRSTSDVYDGDRRIEFTAFDSSFTLELSLNEKLMRNTDVNSLSQVALYKGAIVGKKNSWVRLSLFGGIYTGAIYDGAELYIIDEYKTVSADIAPWAREEMEEARAHTVIYKYADVVDSASCGLDDHNLSSYDQVVDDIRESVAQSDLSAFAVADSQINITIVADTEYVATSNGDVDTQVLSQMNIVDGIFSDQVGVQFGIEDIIPLSDNGPLTSTASETLLSDFMDYVNQRVANPGLVHLFSGKDFDGNTVGRAYVDVLCGDFGVGITQLGGRGSLGAIFAAHEFGHNFGAPHDNQAGSVCAATPGGFLMNPSIGSSNDRFSDCSLQQIAPSVANASCIFPVSVPNPTPTPTPVPTPAPSVCIDLENTTRFASPNSGSASADGCSISLSGNEWRATEQRFTITPSSRLLFEFSSNGRGEISGIGFDEDNLVSSTRIFNLIGSQNWGFSNFDYIGGTQSFDIPVGEFYTGSSMRLVLVNDKDSGPEDNETTVSNVRLVN